MGLDVALVWWAFRANFAAARRAERIEVTAHELILERLADGRPGQEQRFTRGWVRVELEEDRERELIGRLYPAIRAASARKSASFLAPEERKSLAAALKAALGEPAYLSKNRVVCGLARA